MAPRPDALPQIAMVLPRINAVFENAPIPDHACAGYNADDKYQTVLRRGIH